MEFRYRAGDERSRSSPPPPTTTSSGSARDQVPANEDRVTGHYYGGDSAVASWQSSSLSLAVAVAAAGRDELRHARKEKIRDRILREEAEHWEFEAEVRRELAEVRRELMEQIFPLFRRSGHTRSARTTAALQPSQAISNGNASALASALLPAKRKNPATATASAVSAATSSKRPKADLTCAVCGITSTGEKAMQDHLNGKSHKKKKAALALSAPPEPEPEQEEEEDAAAMMPPASDGGFRPTKLSMLTSAGVVYKVLQMDGYLLCQDCNVRMADRVSMMCHLDSGKHVSKATKLKQQAGKPPAPTYASPKKGTKEPAATSGVADGEPGTVVVKVDGEPHAMRRLDEIFILCDVCNVKAPSVTVMQSHLAGRKHKSMAAVKAKAEAAASMTSKVGGKLEVQETGAMTVVANVATNVTDTPEKGNVDIVVDGEHHIVMRIGEFGCTSCNVRATSESDMRLHLARKKHKIKPMAEKAAMEIVKDRSKETPSAASVKGQTATAAVAPLSAPPGDAAQAADGSMAPMEVSQQHHRRGGCNRAAGEDSSGGEDVRGAAAGERSAPVRTLRRALLRQDRHGAAPLHKGTRGQVRGALI